MLTLLIASIVAQPSAAPTPIPTSTPTPAPDAAYTLTLRADEPAVEVTLRTRGEDDGTTSLSVDETWGGISGHGGEITDLSAADAAGNSLMVERGSDHSWIVGHAPGAELSVAYTLRQPPDRARLDGHNDYRTIVRPGLFQMIGNIGLVHPSRLLGAADRTYSIGWRGFDEEGWRCVSSFGHGPGPATVTISADRFRHSLFIAGDLRLSERMLRSSRVAYAIHGQWPFRDEQFVDLANRIIAAERSFFDDFTDPFFLVTLIPVPSSAGSFSLGGTGLTNCFALFCSPQMTLGAGAAHDTAVKRLLAHEYFHTWIGGKIRVEAPEGAGYWFSEGFTDFYARRLLQRTRLYSLDEFVAELNSTLSRYDTSPVRDAPNDRIVREFWTNRDIGGLPYVRGDLAALAIDQKMRDSSGGAANLDTMMYELRRRASGGAPALTPEGLFELIEARTDAGFAGTLRRAILDGAEIPIPERLDEPALVLGTATARVMDLGFDFEASRAASRVIGVRDGSQAQRAGLRDGQVLAAYSISPGSPDNPPHAEITIDEDGARRKISYEPLSPPRAVRCYKPAE